MSGTVDLFGNLVPDRRSLGSHESATGGTDEWLTPPDPAVKRLRAAQDPGCPMGVAA